MMETLIANLKYAARNGETVTIGGGSFSPEEIKAAVEQYEAMKERLNETDF
jgi:hypothetical protein